MNTPAARSPDGWPDTMIDELRQRLTADPLPGNAAQRTFAPELSYGRHSGPSPRSARRAAVMLLLYRHQGDWFVPLTRRPAHLPTHGGQVSLPGGAIEAGETTEGAALRELEEELGVRPGDVTLLGRLSELYVFGTDYAVTPLVGFSERASLPFRPDPGEVAELLEIPLAELRDRRLRGMRTMQRRGVRFRAPHLTLRGHTVWGATAMILGEFLHVLEELPCLVTGPSSR